MIEITEKNKGLSSCRTKVAIRIIDPMGAPHPPTFSCNKDFREINI